MNAIAAWWEDFKEIVAIGTPDPLMDIQVQVKLPKGAPDAGVEIYGTFNDGNAIMMNYNTQYGIWWADIQASELQVFNFREAGNPDNYIEYSTDGLNYRALEDIVKKVILPEGLTHVGINAFALSTHLTAVEWNAADCPTYEEGEYVYPPFYATCSKITSLVLGESVRVVPSYLCYEMTNLATMTVPAGVTSIGLAAFYGCPKAIITVLGESPATMGNYAFENVPAIFVPCGTLAAYQKAWKAYKSVIQYPLLTVTITGLVNDEAAGHVVVPTTVCDNEEVLAVANEGYQFVEWSDGVKDNPRTIELTEDATYTAVFELIPEAVEDITVDTAPRKLIREGHVLIQRDGKIYNLQGVAL